MTILEDAAGFLAEWAPGLVVTQDAGFVVVRVSHAPHNFVLRVGPEVATALAVVLSETAKQVLPEET